MNSSAKKTLKVNLVASNRKPACPAGFHVLSDAEFEYLQRALKYAKDRGFKTILFDKNGKVIALQG